MTEPTALDLFCCAGGSTTGLQRAGFRVVGVDVKRHKAYRGDDFLLRDLSTEAAVRGVIDEVRPDFISSSPPCQQFSTATPTRNRMDHPNLIPSTRAAIVASGVPGWIENVHGAPLHNSIRLCGTMFHATYGIKRHRFFELVGWYALEPEHRWCVYGPPEDVTWTDPLGVTGTTAGSAARRVAVAVAVAGHGPPDAAQSREYRERRAVESIHDGSMMTNSRAALVRRKTTGVYGFVDAPDSQRAAERRSVVSVNGDNGSRGRGPREKRTRDGSKIMAEPDARRRETVMLSVHQGEGPGQYVGQNRPGPECIRWRTAMGWIDGPKDRFGLAQAVPPAYAEWLARTFLAGRAT